MATESPGIATPSGSDTIYGAISRVTYTKTVTEPGPDSISSISASFWPSQSTIPVLYTSLAAPSDSTSENFPNPLPIFIATYVEVVVVNTAGLTISTLIEVPSQPAYVYGASILGDTETSCTGNFYTCWSTGKRAGIVIAVIMGGLVVLIFLVWFCCFMRIHGSQPPDEEESHGSRMRERERDLGEGEDSRRKRVSRSNHELVDRQDRDRINRRRGSALSETCTEPPRPLPRMVTADGYREERRVSRLPRHIRLGALSVSSAGAVLGVGERDTRRDGMYFPEKTVHGSTVVDDLADAHGVMSTSGAAKDSNAKTVPTMAMTLNPPPQIRPNSDMPYRKLRSISENHRDVDQQERGRSLGRKHSSRKAPPRLQSYSPCRRSDSPPTDNRNSFAPYAPVVVAVLEDLWKKAEQSLPRIVYRSSSVYSTDPERRSQRRSFREDRRISRQRKRSSRVDQLRRSRSVPQDVRMSGGLQESAVGEPPLIRRKPSHRRSSKYI